MKILYYHQHFSTPLGSTGTRSYEFAKKLIEKGHSVTMICGSYWIANSGLGGSFKNGFRAGNVDGINVVEFDLNYSNRDNFIKRAITFLKFSFKGVRLALKKDYDLVFATSTPLTSSIPGIFAKFIRNKPFIFEVRDLWPELPRAMGVIKNPFVLLLMSFLEFISYKSAVACIGLSPGIVKGIKKRVPDKKIIMIPNGSDLNLLNSALSRKNDNKFIAVFTGAHGLANGLDSVLDAAKILINKSINDIEIHFIGDGALKEKLIKRAADEGLVNCIFLDPLPKIELFNYLKVNADVGLMILDNVPEFYYGTSPNKFFDYIGLGLPIINNYPGWISEMIKEKNCGLYIDPGNSQAFASALMLLKRDKVLLKKMGNNSRLLAEKSFDRKDLSLKFVNFIEECIKS